VWCDIRIGGAPIFRTLLVVVDGGRSVLPLPSGYAETRRVPMAYSRLARLVQRLRRIDVEYDDYFRRAGLFKTGDDWP
jgi:hypothetical protein